MHTPGALVKVSVAQDYNADLPFIPILLITAYDQLSVARGLDTGADDFIRKPVEYDELCQSFE